MKIEKRELMVNGNVYKKALKAPSCRDILKASKEQRLKRLGKEVSVGLPKLFQGQEFLAYTVKVKI